MKKPNLCPEIQMTLISEVLSLNHAKLRKTKKREFKQAILDKLEHLQSNNPKEYSIDDHEWFNYFSHLSSIPNHINESIEKIK